MAAQRRLPLLCIFLAGVLAEPAPGRIPKVYNALITSNQNLEPSKAYPVYQPVLHNAFPFPYQPVFYGDLPLTNGLIPGPAAVPKDADAKPDNSPSSTTESPAEEPVEKPTPPQAPEPSPAPEDNKPISATSPPEPPKTESPIPLNEFGLPSQIFPIGAGHFSTPTYQYTNFAFPYAYPGLRFYDPYNPFGIPYAGLPFYQPLTNILGAGAPIPALKAEAPAASPASSEQTSQTPPSEPSDLRDVRDVKDEGTWLKRWGYYTSNDPRIPNVPAPPTPQRGPKANAE